MGGAKDIPALYWVSVNVMSLPDDSWSSKLENLKWILSYKSNFINEPSTCLWKVLQKESASFYPCYSPRDNWAPPGLTD